MVGLGGSEGINVTPEIPLASQLAQESKAMVAKLKDLKLDDPSAPGMFVFGEESPIAILLGKIEIPVDSMETADMRSKHLIIAPQGFLLAEGNSDISQNNEALSSTLESIRKKTQETPPDISIDEKNHKLKIITNGKHLVFSIKKVEATPEQFSEMLKSAIGSSREIAQKPLMGNVLRAKAGNAMLDAMVAQEKSSYFPPPFTPPPPGLKSLL